MRIGKRHTYSRNNRCLGALSIAYNNPALSENSTFEEYSGDRVTEVGT